MKQINSLNVSVDKKELLESVKSPDKQPQRRFCYEHSE